MDEARPEIVMTQVFNSSDMVTESDLWLRFQIREILRRANGVLTQDKVFILNDEARLLREDTLGFDDTKPAQTNKQ